MATSGTSTQGPDQWYYLDGAETRGPVPAMQIAQLVKGGSLSATTQVAQAGWTTWSPASVALSHLLGGGGQPHAGPGAAEPPTYAIKVQCVSGPDAGKAYMIGAPEVSLGRVSGIGLGDPQIAENHVVLSWQNNVLYFRTFPGSRLRVANTDVTQGTLSNGQQFQMGSSTWQVGSAPVDLSNLVGTLGSRLNKLTSTDKLEGFSLGAMFSEVFKGRKPGEMEEYFVVGTTKTTPSIDDVQTGWPKPWFFMRVFLFMVGIYFLFYEMFDTFDNPRLVPGLIVMGSFVVPLTVAFLFWELNTPRNVSLPMLLMLVCLGGVISLFVSLIAFDITNLEWLGAASAGICEETGKLLTVVLVVRSTRYKYILNGVLFGAAVGAGFGAFETAGYGFNDGFVNDFLAYFFKNPAHEEVKPLVNHALSFGYEGMLAIIHRRSVLLAFTHPIWASISAGALWRIKGAEKFRFNMLTEPTFLRTFIIPMSLHALWNSPLLRFQGLLGYAKEVGISFVGVFVVLSLVQQGLRQIRDAQVTQTKNEYQRTQEILTTTGRFRTTVQ